MYIVQFKTSPKNNIKKDFVVKSSQNFFRTRCVGTQLSFSQQNAEWRFEDQIEYEKFKNFINLLIGNNTNYEKSENKTRQIGKRAVILLILI